MAAPATVRVCRAHGSVVVVSPASSPSSNDREREVVFDALHRVGRPSRLLRGRGRGGRQGAAGRAGADRARGAGAVCAESRRRRRGCVGGDRQRARNRADHRAARGSGGAREPEGGQGDHPGGREDRQDRRAHAGEAARRRLSARGLAAGRADADPAPADLGSGTAGAAAHAGQEPGARDADPQPERQAARERPLRHPRTALARRAGPTPPTSRRRSRPACARSRFSTPRSH